MRAVRRSFRKRRSRANMIKALQQELEVSIDELYRIVKLESEEALGTAQRGLEDADFRGRVAVPACFPEGEPRSPRRRDAAGRLDRPWM